MVLQRVTDLRREIGLQLLEMRQTWIENPRARFWVICAAGAAMAVVSLAIAVDLARYFDLHHYEARFFSLTTDRGLPELVMDLLVIAAAVLTALLYRKTGLRGFLLVAALLCLVALDDFFSFHEDLGADLVSYLGLVDHAGFKGQALGELAIMVVFALFCIPFLLWAIWGMQPANLAVLVIYGVIFTAFAGFAGGVDALHSLVDSSVMDRLMGWIEDGGEIVVIAILTAVTILQAYGRLR
jgi:hypothetical protein